MNKIIVFDLDGTFYDLNDVLRMSYDMQVSFLCMKRNVCQEEAIRFLQDNHIYPVMKKDSKSATELFLKMGYDKSEWSTYRVAGFDVNKIDRSKAIDEKTIIDFAKYGILVLLSSNAYVIVEKVLKWIGISPSVFDEVICSDRFPYNTPFKKKMAMEYLAGKYKKPFSEMISIGDRYSTDIQPMTELGGMGVLISTPASLKSVYSDMKSRNLRTCDLYTVF